MDWESLRACEAAAHGCVGVAATVPTGVREGGASTAPEGEALALGGVGGAATPPTAGLVALAVPVGEELPVTVEVGEPVGDTVPVGVPVEGGVGDGVELPLREALHVREGDAPTVSVAVGLFVTVELPLRVEVGVPGGVAVAVGVGDAVGVPLREAVGVAAPLREVLPVTEGEAPAVSDAVIDADTVELPDAAEEGVSDAVPVGVGVDEPVGELVGVLAGVTLPLTDALPVLEADAL